MNAEQRLAGGNTGGAVRIGDTVRRTPGAWTPSVHAVLRHLEAVGFDRAPRALGFDEQGREVLSFLPGNVVGDSRPWPRWVHSDQALHQVAGWLRELHGAIAGFTPAPDAVWHEGGTWRPELIIGQNDAAPYNAAWADGQLTGLLRLGLRRTRHRRVGSRLHGLRLGAASRPPCGGGGRIHRVCPATQEATAVPRHLTGGTAPSDRS